MWKIEDGEGQTSEGHLHTYVHQDEECEKMHDPKAKHLRESAAVASGFLPRRLPNLFQAFCRPATRRARNPSVIGDVELAGDTTILRLQAENDKKKCAIDACDRE